MEDAIREIWQNYCNGLKKRFNGELKYKRVHHYQLRRLWHVMESPKLGKLALCSMKSKLLKNIASWNRIIFN